MREIKFRAWNKEYGYMLSILSMKDLCITGGELSKEDYDNIVIMEYIGLKDKNGVEIYEGDIVKAINMSHNKEVLKEWTGEVKYGHNNCCYGLNRKLNISNDLSVAVMQNINYPLHNFMNFGCGIVPDIDLEVIGNIYENPELLEED